MKNQTKILIVSILTVLLLGAMIFGATFAYFSATANSVGNITGDTYNFDVAIAFNKVKSDGLVPVMDNLILTSLNSTNKCVGTNNDSLCSIYQITLTNNGEQETLTGSIKTGSGTTYTTNHLKYQLYTLSSNTYTAVTDTGNLSKTPGSTNNFMSSSNNFTVELNESQSKTYYLVIWLSDIGANQLEDANKKFTGSVEFISENGNQISADFTA